MAREQVALSLVTSRQFGVLTRQQARSAGVSSSTVKTYLSSRRWVAMFRGVYRETSVPRSREQMAVAAWLACGPRAAISHRSAAVFWKLEVPATTLPEVTVPDDRRPVRGGVRIYRTNRWTAREVVHYRGLVLTTPLRTLVDLAAVVDEQTLESAHDNLWRRRQLTPMRVREVLASAPCRSLRGTHVLRRIVEARLGQRANESELETLYFGLLRSNGLPLPTTQVDVWTPSGVRRLDYAYRDAKVAIELDGFDERFGNRMRFDDDRDRQNELVVLGWRFLRFTKTHVTSGPMGVLMRTAESIRMRPSRWRSDPA